MRRTDLQSFADAKLEDARVLLANGRHSSAYYLAGYAVELGLKACIARQISAETIPDKSILKDVLTHDFGKLVGLAGLRGELKQEEDRSVDFSANWGIANEWTPDDRYVVHVAIDAQTLIAALEDDKNGVLQWIRRYW